MSVFIDLSMPVDEETIVFPGDAKPVFEPAGTLEKDDFIDHVIHINNHLGTHIDAPGHMIRNGKMLADYEISRFVVDAICIDARNRATLAVDLLAGINIHPGMAVVFYTGCGDNYTAPSYATEYPLMDRELASFLVEKNVSTVGIDTISFDRDAPFAIHKILLAGDILIVENLVNLASVAKKNFKLYAFPVNFRLEAAPARVVAKVV